MKRKAFTLIELLAVIAIISLLVSILMPSLAKAKELARRAACSGNLHTIAVAAQLYGADFKDWLPWRGQIEGNDPNVANCSWTSDGRLAWQGYLPGYTLKYGGKVFYCPSMSRAYEEFNLPKGWPGAYGIYWWGYDYFAMYVQTDAAGKVVMGANGKPINGMYWTGTLPSPTRITDNSRSPILADITRGFTDTSWTYYAHGAGGGWFNGGFGIAQSATLKPEGLNSAQLDGSVKWCRYGPGGGKMEYGVNSGYWPGFYQAKTSK